jgi:hypothetical protein
MTVLGIDDDLEYYDVLLGLGSVDVKPKVGSNCLIGFINNSETLPFLIMADEVEEIDIKTQFKVQLNISDKGILVPLKNIDKDTAIGYKLDKYLTDYAIKYGEYLGLDNHIWNK